MSRDRLNNLDPKRKQLLFESAADEFLRHGFEGASLNAIIKKSNMGKSSLYYYFDGKADLFSSLLEKSLENLLSSARLFKVSDLGAENYWDELSAFHQGMMERAAGNAWHIKFARMIYRLRQDKRASSPVNLAFRPVLNLVNSVLEQGQLLGVVRVDLPLAILLDSTIALSEIFDGWLLSEWDQLTPADRTAMAHKQFKTIQALLMVSG